jgi:XTP/dITP diphosphohydrolase
MGIIFTIMNESNPSELPVLVFATHNPNKAQEVQRMLGSAFRIQTLTDIGCHEEISETATDLKGNALIKAQYVSEVYGLDCFADDTGLEVDALNGAPGVRTARYAGENSDSQANMRKLLLAMSKIPDLERSARFRTTICLIRGGDVTYIEGTCEGSIALNQSGAQGFGYDPVFIPQGESVTFAEMTGTSKNEISHRGKAIRFMVGELLGKSS